MGKKSKIGRVIKLFRSALPCDRKIIVRFRKLSKFAGTIEFNSPVAYIITLDPNHSYACILDTLIHEWAHCLDDTPWAYREEHRDSWGVWYSRAYRVWLRFSNSAAGKRLGV